ncbi:hypothetical protein J32TS6_21270 [Virgibacillus pantothenticus]|uniref:Uncharacterized protein n=1 Tax=Virgibacillus pantothenticus TaxID=1473 RepID=A0A0L0QSE9_VIRPA|nr:hypothetical protein [Virgibacillus pantothenticus]KNE21620.1 hypothetical protein AFK71_08245 [Virgibacillus pantothenticus]MED3735345.1 hypothetical protein [Virgibacillus pantothenticus]QTY15949.1 hypothetical protein KBP50_19320 [Virgibacillus pantothenticus]SIS74338.1 hypothetical protein SAMN05421787_102570 [Virgibacillus pantothenticus]GIP63572.1 hypothetical protein J32TS6_21270 [Virgibacillus pantothenticus]
MQMEEKIISMLEQISKDVKEQGDKIGSLEKRFDSLEQRFDSLETRFNQQEQKLDEQGQRITTIEQRLDEHKDILTALRSGQEYLKAEIDGMRVENAKEFGYVKKELSNMHLNFSVLRDDVWTNKKEIYQLKKAGME